MNCTVYLIFGACSCELTSLISANHKPSCFFQHSNNTGKCMTRNLMFISTDRIFHFSWLPCISNPLEKKTYLCTLYVPPSLWKFASFRTPTPQNFPYPLHGVWMFSGITKFLLNFPNHCQFSTQVC